MKCAGEVECRRAQKIAGLAGKAADNFARYTEKVMFRNASIAMLSAAILLEPTVSVQAAEYATAQEAKALLVKAVAAVKEDEAKALNIFQAGTDGFKDRDLYVWCANVSNGILTAHPTNKGKDLRKLVGEKRLPIRPRDYAEGRRNDKGDYLLVAAPWLGCAAQEDDLLHEGRR